MSLAGQNLKYLHKLRGWTQEEFANKVGIKRSLVGRMKKSGRSKAWCTGNCGEIFQLSLDDLLLKDLSDTGGSYLSNAASKNDECRQKCDSFVPVKAAAGYLAGYADAEFIDELNTFTLPMLSGW